MLDWLKELWRYKDLVYNLVARDLKVRYKNSILGIVWSWLNPLLMMLIFTFVFGVLYDRTDIPNYHIHFLSALLPWNFFSSAVMGGIPSIVGSAHLVKKVYFPARGAAHLGSAFQSGQLHYRPARLLHPGGDLRCDANPVRAVAPDPDPH